MNELELILTDICHCSRAELHLNASSKTLNENQLRRLEKVLKERARSIPVHYSLGHTEFMGLYFKVNKHVLIPRPETEQLVELALDIIAERKPARRRSKVVDIGTGSGCIAIALAKLSRQPLDIIGVDTSKKALAVARENAKKHSVLDSIRLVQSDLFNHPLFKRENTFDIIVSNPPYVPTGEIGAFDVTTTNEPIIALDGGFDGCDVYRRLSSEGRAHIKKDGLFIFEIGENQADCIRDIFSHQWIIEQFVKDYRKVERICIARPKAKHNG